MFRICDFRNSDYCQILHHDFWMMQMDLCPDLELSMGNYAKTFSLKFDPNKNKIFSHFFTIFYYLVVKLYRFIRLIACVYQILGNREKGEFIALLRFLYKLCMPAKNE